MKNLSLQASSPAPSERSIFWDSFELSSHLSPFVLRSHGMLGWKVLRRCPTRWVYPVPTTQRTQVSFPPCPDPDSAGHLAVKVGRNSSPPRSSVARRLASPAVLSHRPPHPSRLLQEDQQPSGPGGGDAGQQEITWKDAGHGG